MAKSTTKVGVGRKSRVSNRQNLPFLIMMLPGIVVLIINNYMPMAGTVMAFKQYRFKGNFLNSLATSEWVGLDNFKFLFLNPSLWETLRNTLVYNIVFILVGMIVPVAFAIAMNELWWPKVGKLYQTIIFLPYFLSWIIVSYLVFAILQNAGVINSMFIIPATGTPVNFYGKGMRSFWPGLLIFLQAWKYTGYNTVVYLASLSGISKEYYEAASIDGVSRMQQIWYITLPMLRPIIIILSLLACGRIFNSDFGLFYNVPMDRSSIFPVTEVLDTYIYRAMRGATEYGMPVAAGLFQSVMGCITIVSANLIVRKIDADSSLF